ncbi:Transcription initiation factor TFIID subunit 9 [Rhodotorula toruloides]
MPPQTPQASQPVLPRDARLIALILAAAGAEDCEEGVVRMLVEFAHRYTSDVLTDSLLYAEHARVGSTSTAPVVPSVEDVRLAVQARTEGAQVPKEFLLQLANTVNAVPLPPVPEVYGIRLPPPAQRLTAPNFSIVPRSAGPPDALAAFDAGLGTNGDGTATAEGSEGVGGGLFGDDDEDDDAGMEEVEAGLVGTNGSSSSGGGVKRRAEEDEDYD